MLGILSDTHNNRSNLQAALEVFRAAGVNTLIHCGDLTSPDMISLLDGFRVILTFGNGDFATGEMLQNLKALNPASEAAMVYTGEVDGVAIAATHGHLREQLDALVDSRHYAYIFRGHSHRHGDILRGPTHVVNPGALGGLHPEPRQVCLLDLPSGMLRFVQIEPKDPG